jgi:hypothetical protein
MSRLTSADIDGVEPHVSDTAAGAISLKELSRRLGVSVPTALRRLRAYAKVHGMTLRSVPAREGARGRLSARWFASRAALPQPVRAPEPPSGLIPPAILNALDEDERRSLELLARVGTARTGEMAAVIGRTPDRMEGLLRVLRRKLYRMGSPMIDNETLPDGEALFRFIGPRT